jgi:hypothetical protein
MSNQLPKSVREALCAAQSALHQVGMNNVHKTQAYCDELQHMIDHIDKIRPLRADGKHGTRRCTYACGCENHVGWWAIKFFPTRVD